MVFSSVVFLFLFLPIVLGLYYLVGKKYHNLLLAFSSLLFYFWGEGFLIWIIIVSSCVDYLSGLIISGGFREGPIEKLPLKGKRAPAQRFGLFFSLIVNLGLLGYFKYYNFGVDNLIALLQVIGLESEGLESVARITLPLGISFYTFQSMSYTLDVYKGHLKATRNFLDFICYVTLFPQLVAGPIVRYRDVEKELHTRELALGDFISGLERFVQGLIKKVIISNALARVVDPVFRLGEGELYTSLAWAGVLGFIFQLYFDFSGYSDMAIGLGRMFGFHFKENFHWPLISKSWTEFWQRWHISLSSWIRDYVYAPIRNRNRRPSTAGVFRQQIFIFTLIGFWHGANWTFIIFGIISGFVIAAERTWLRKFLSNSPNFVLRLYFFLIALVCFTIFRCDNLEQTVLVFKAMVGIHNADKTIVPFGMLVRPDIVLTYLIAGVFSTPIFEKGKTWLAAHLETERMKSIASSIYIVVLAFLALLAVGQIASGTYNPFIYFRF